MFCSQYFYLGFRYRATEMFVKPLTRSFRCSFAELVATEPQEGDLWDGPSSLRAMDPGEVPKWFVSHWHLGLRAVGFEGSLNRSLSGGALL